MNEEFSVDENGLTSDGYRVLPASSKRAMYLGNLIKLLILAVGVNLVRFGILALTDGYTDLVNASMYAVFIAGFLYLIISPGVFYDHYRYRIDDEKVEVRKGIIVIRHVLVPVERIHQVQVSKGPINRHYGLAEVDITTAGGSVAIEYLEESVAEGIATKLNRSVVDILKQRD